ncbi:hypothetical protein SODALDRAFT_338703 [Sodiomyces alkalinus F11]|uniref:Zn(2)-C6 fungal-type domain-containing protein n=1 Tax=Sodiomyces alkalinus (strain CBS 110278 / VKM F-3762 / F11) TaxID=1314773 RepID=A0A3N2Q3H8_SODAK|nr:hypothetical protein SODALDRAFT_338703 [Sodiomyces alkalinus F11]ROT41319.1 hypothetical protein SODALDRAFT_338703 [Sodiomyces alkalinus F11]
MPNVGRPSKDCHLCRKRRVKCDLTRPSCQRCIKYGTECPGYRNVQDLIFRTEDPASAGRDQAKKERARTTRRSPTSVLSSSHPVGFPSDDVSSTSGTSSSFSGTRHPMARCRSFLPPYAASNASPIVTLPHELKEPWTTHSIPLLMSCYSSMTFLAKLYSSVTTSEDPFVLSTHLWAKAYLISRFNAPHDRRETAEYLGRTLRSLSLALQDRRKKASDTTVMAVWMLSIYEVQIGGLTNRSDSPSPWDVHSQGLMSLLRARGSTRFLTEIGCAVFWCAYNIIQIHCLMTNTECPPESWDWIRNLSAKGVDEEESFLLGILRYLNHTCSIVSIVMPLVQHGLFLDACTNYDELVRQADAAERSIVPWMGFFRATAGGADATTRYFLNVWWSARIKLHHMLVLLTNLVADAPVRTPSLHSADLQSRRASYLAIVAEAARDIIDDMPVSLGGLSGESETTGTHAADWYEGVRLVWPLTVVYTVRTVPKDLRLAARTALFFIGKHRGIIQALKSRPGTTTYVPQAMTGIPVDDLLDNPELVPELPHQSGLL